MNMDLTKNNFIKLITSKIYDLKLQKVTKELQM